MDGEVGEVDEEVVVGEEGEEEAVIGTLSLLEGREERDHIGNIMRGKRNRAMERDMRKREEDIIDRQEDIEEERESSTWLKRNDETFFI